MTTALTAGQTYKHVEHCMGTVFSFHVACDDSARAGEAVADAVAWLHWVDETFSTYRAESCLSRYSRGEITLADCPAQVEQILARCAELEARTGGYFTANVGGRLDPSGLVKGWAIERASDILVSAGAPHHMINGGGDVQCRGVDATGQPWHIGIANPADHDTLLGVATGSELAVATSGTAERGTHILNPVLARPADELVSVSVVGPRLMIVDAYATAAFAMGGGAASWLAARDPAEVSAFMVVGKDGSITSATSAPGE